MEVQHHHLLFPEGETDAQQDEVVVVIQQLRRAGLKYKSLSSLCLGIFPVIRSFLLKKKKIVYQLRTSSV